MTKSPVAETEEGKRVEHLDLRAQVAAHLQEGELHRATQAARMLLDEDCGRRNCRFLRDVLNEAGAERTGLKPIKVALLSSFSIEFLHDSLIALGFAGGLDVRIYQAPFDAFRSELLDAGSGLYDSRVDVVILAVEGEGWMPEAFDGYFDSLGSGSEALAKRFGNELAQLVSSFRTRSRAPLLIHNIALPAHRKLGIFDPKSKDSHGTLINRMNEAMAAIARDSVDVHIVDYAALVNRHGATNWYDNRMRHYARAPIAGAMQPLLSAEYIKFLRTFTGLASKCLVVDLDNTLWGGVVGEEGANGIALGPTYPGSAHAEFQRYILDLYHRGVIIAVASKNNPADVDEVFEKNPFMLLRPEHFASMQINWDAKSQSLLRIAETLSIGLEHMVFVDDNPVECAEVRRALPMVRTIALPPRPEAYVETLQRAAPFDTLGISDEDRRRGALYRQRAQAEATRGAMTNVEDYYRDLAMQIAIAPVNEASLARTAQLTQKTNQFNVTTLRYSEADVSDRAASTDWTVATVSVKDRFGDNGIVGVLMAKAESERIEIDTLLLSCRVIGRTVETAMLAQLCDEARRRGIDSLSGRVVPTKKNMPARDLFERHGFICTGTDTNGTTHWQLSLADGGVQWPPWFTRKD